MIKQISWASYFTAIGVTLTFYYTIICFKYYLNDIKEILAGKSKWFFKGKLFDSSIKARHNFETTANNFEETDNNQNLFPVINQIAQEIKMTLEDAARKNQARQEVVCALQLLLRKYTAIKQTPFELIVNNYILIECSNYCSIHLEKEEVNMLWGSR
jgi:hypothetical protein